MRELLPFIITGLVSGSLYGLAGMGLVLTYRTSGVFNFGHGAIAAGAAFLFYTLHHSRGLAWPLAASIVLGLFTIVVGFVMDRITRWLGDVPGAVVVVATVGVFLSINGLLYLVYGNVTRTFPPFLPSSGFTVEGVNISWGDVISVTLAGGGALVLYVFLRRSRLGVAMRAVVDNPMLVSLTGERAGRVRAVSWSIGSGFAALSGILLAPTLGLDPNLLTLLVVQAFGACAIGRFTSLPMTYVGGLVVGVAASLATRYVTEQPFTGIPSTVPYLFLILVLLTVPVAKLPQRRASLRSLIPEAAPSSRRTSWILGGGGLAALLVLPQLTGPKLPIWTSALTYVVIFASLALLVWVSGQISLCHMAFVALGATSMSHFAEHVPWFVALLLAGATVAPVGALVAIPAIRLSGIYLALITLGFGILMQNVVFPSSLMFGSGLVVSVHRPELGPIDGSDQSLYYIGLAIAVVTGAVLTAAYHGRLGRLLRAMSESPTMLSTHGVGVATTRMIVFCISAFFAGIGGALAITQTGSASGIAYGPIQSLMLLAVLAICGTHLVRSSLLAAGLFAVLPGYVTAFGSDEQIFGFGVLAIAAALIIARRSELSEWVARAAATSRERVGHGPVVDHARELPAGIAPVPREAVHA